MQVDVIEAAPDTFLVSGAKTNWCLLRDGDAVTLVDAGWPKDFDLVSDSLAQIGSAPGAVEAIILTHAHPDHIGVAERFRTELGTPVHVHRDEAAHAEGRRHEQVGVVDLLLRVWRPSVAMFVMNSIMKGGLSPTPVGTVGTFDEAGAPLDVPGRPIPIATPGHTSGHTSFHLPGRGALLTGDALVNDNLLTSGRGARLLPRIFNHDWEAAIASLDRLAGLEAEVLLTGHGAPLHLTPAEATEQARGLARSAAWWN